MRQDEPLIQRQVEVLQWISAGCPDEVWRDSTYKSTAYALAARGLVTVDRRRNHWSAAVTDDGRFYVEHGDYRSSKILVDDTAIAVSDTDSEHLADELLTELAAGDRRVTVASPSDRERARYRRAIHRLISEGRIPEGFVLRHTGRDHGDLSIRLVPHGEAARPAPPPRIAVPQTIGSVTDEVRVLAAQVQIKVTEPTMGRALRVLQAISAECANRGWTLERDPRDDRRFQIATAEGTFEFSLREELVDREVPEDDKLAAAKYSWQRIPLQVRKVGSSRLTLQLGQYSRSRSWSDRRRWTLDDKLGAFFTEVDTRVAEAAEARQRREKDLLRRQQLWDAAVVAAQEAYIVDFNQRRLQDQVARRAQAQAYRDYIRSLDVAVDGCDDLATVEAIRGWQQWTHTEADRIDPLCDLESLSYVQPETITVADYAPFMPDGMNPHRRPTN